MSQSVRANFSFGSSRTALDDVRVQPRKADGTSTGAAITAGVTEVGKGMYRFAGDVPDDAAFLTGYSNANPSTVVDEVAIEAAPPTAAGIADAVWDEATSGHQSAGTTGKALTDAGAGEGSDVWAEEEKDRVLLQVNKLTSSTIYVSDPVQGGTIGLFKGDSYPSGHGRPLDVPMAEGANWPTDLAGWTIKLTATRTAQCVDQSGVASIELTGSVLTATGDNRTVRFEPTAAQTATLSLGIGNKGYECKVVATKDGDQATLFSGYLSVRP